MKVLLLHLEQFAYPTAKRNVWGVHWCKEIKNKLSHMLKCMYSQNWWLDRSTPSPSNVICDLLFYNKLPYHVILAGRSNHACKKQSNYSPSCLRNLLQSLRALYTQCSNTSLLYSSCLKLWTSDYKQPLNLICMISCMVLLSVTNAFLSHTVSYKALPEEEWVLTFWLWANMSI